MKPASRGPVRLAARDITVPPQIDPNYLSDQADVDRLLAGAQDGKRDRQPRIAEGMERRGNLPGPGRQDRASRAEYLRTARTSYRATRL